MKAIEYFDEAEKEVVAALTESKLLSDRVSREFQQMIERVIVDIRSGLLTAAKYPRTECREYVLQRYPYSVIYIDDPDTIRVVAFAHAKRRRGYWKSRLPRS